MKDALFIVNRQSRSGENDFSEAVELLREKGIRVTCSRPEPEQINDLIKMGCPSAELIIIAGGDGTLNRAAEALVQRGLPVGILPAGTANDLARTLDIPTGIEAACNVIAGGHSRSIDLGWVNNKLFFNVASLGISSAIVRKLSPEAKRKWGIFSYMAALLQSLRESRPFRAVIICNGARTKVQTIQISVGNGIYHGGGIAVAADASIDDHLLDIYSLRPLTFWQLVRLAPAIYEGEHGRRTDRVTFLHCREAEIHTSRSMVINTDGEETTRTPAFFKVIPLALTFLVPLPGNRS